MEKILERYENYTYAEKALKSPDLESPVSRLGEVMHVYSSLPYALLF